MTIDDAHRDDLLANLLEQYERSLASGTRDTTFDSAVVGDPQLADQWRGAKHCLELLDQVRRYWTPDEATNDTVGWLRSALATPPIEPDRTLGRFRIVRELGRGGLGVVYLAQDPQLGRPIALKVPRIEALASDDMRRRFVREAETAARLSHPHIVTVHDAGEEGPICYIAAEYCAGPTLAEWLRDQNEPTPIPLAVTIIAKLADAVQHAHSRGVLHRDIKPSNVLLTRIEERSPLAEAATTAPAATHSGSSEPERSSPADQARRAAGGRELSPKLTDFGMAKLLEGAQDDTRSGVLIGTPAYMAPEQAQGRTSDLDARTDVYALGAMLYELLTRRRPHPGDNDVDVLRRALFEEPAPPRRWRPEISRDLEAICLKCLAKRPEERYATAQQLSDDLARYLAGHPTEARPLSTAGRLWRWAKRRPALAALLTAVALSAVALFGVVLVYNARLNQQIEVARQESEARRKLLYCADIRLAHQALEANNVAQVLAALDRQRPSTGQEDLREFAWHYLHHQCNLEALSLRGHEDEVFSAAYAPDGRRLASAGKDGTVRLWDAATGQQLHTLRGHATEVTCVAYSPDGRLLASGSEDHTICLWDAALGTRQSVLAGHTDHVLAIAFSPDGRWLVSGGRDHVVRVWDTATRNLERQLDEPQDAVATVAFSPDGLLLAAGDDSGRIHCWSPEDWSPRGGLTPPESREIMALAFAPGRPLMVGASNTPAMRYYGWNADGLAWWKSVPHEHRDKVQSLAFSPADATLATAAKDGVIKLWSFGEREEAPPSLTQTIRGHTARVWSVGWSPDGRYLASVGADKLLKIWDTSRPAGASMFSTRGFAYGRADLSPDGATLVAGCLDGCVEFWDLRSQAFQRRRRVLADAMPVTAVRFSPDGTRLAVAVKPDRVAIVATGTLDIQREFHWPASGGNWLAWSPASRLLMAGGRDGLRIIDATTGTKTFQLQTDNFVSDCAFSADGERFAVAPARMQLFETRTGQLLHTFDEADRCAFSPDGRLLVSSRRDVVTVWDARTFQKLYSLTPQQQDIRALCISPSGRTLAAALREPIVCLWDLRTGQELLELRCEGGQLISLKTLCFTPDEERLVAVGGCEVGGEPRPGQVWEWRAPRP